MSSSRDTDLATPEVALASYLDDLLHTATDAALKDEAQAEPELLQAKPVEETRPEPEPEPEVPAEPEPESKPQVIAQPAVTEPQVTPVVAQETAPAPVVARKIASASTPDVPAGGEPVGRPEWSERPFECLIFRVAGLQLAVPLILLGAIHRLEDGIKAMPGSPRWYMGILPGKDHNLRVVDSAEWIMAGRGPDNARENYRFVIRLDQSEWALACDDVAQSFTLNPDDVRWRTSRSKRPWLAGTVIKQMCALLDVGTMAELLARAEREQHLNME
ncbi:chemotaxis protein CheW [Marinobacter mobilis]|uniref:chemotaxis protein CheW n=1 Tax=Marinobacter mobilis TaxID=488533 RepID=UPI0035C742AE